MTFIFCDGLTASTVGLIPVAILRLPRGTTIINDLELLTQSRLMDLYGLKQVGQSPTWRVNVQPFSGANANMAVMMALLKPGDRMMGLNWAHGGHSTHGMYVKGKPVSAASIFYDHMHFGLDMNSEMIDYENLDEQAVNFKPRMIMAGSSTHPRLMNYARLREICNKIGALLVIDMAHIAGLVAAKVIRSPFDHADVVTSSTQKTLRGPRTGIILSRNQPMIDNMLHDLGSDDLPTLIDQAVFPGLQSGPHLNTIAGLATALDEAKRPEFVDYSKQVLANAFLLADLLQNAGLRLVTGGTDIHFLVIDLARSTTLHSGGGGIGKGDAKLVQVVADLCGLVFSAIPTPHDDGRDKHSGLRIDDHNQALDVISSNPRLTDRVSEMRQRIVDFTSQYPMPGLDDI